MNWRTHLTAPEAAEVASLEASITAAQLHRRKLYERAKKRAQRAGAKDA